MEPVFVGIVHLLGVSLTTWPRLIVARSNDYAQANDHTLARVGAQAIPTKCDGVLSTASCASSESPGTNLQPDAHSPVYHAPCTISPHPMDDVWAGGPPHPSENNRCASQSYFRSCLFGLVWFALRSVFLLFFLFWFIHTHTDKTHNHVVQSIAIRTFMPILMPHCATSHTRRRLSLRPSQAADESAAPKAHRWRWQGECASPPPSNAWRSRTKLT